MQFKISERKRNEFEIKEKLELKDKEILHLIENEQKLN
jgi:hypothetical protein